MNENTLNEVGHIHLSRFGLLVTCTLLFFLTFAVMAVLIWFTPLKNYLPGYNENIRQELIITTVRMDSLQNRLAQQTHYINTLRAITSGELPVDTIRSLDSLTLIRQTASLQEKSPITEAFIQQYEEKEADYLTLFDSQVSKPIFTFFRPAQGKVEGAGKGIVIEVQENANITSVLAGTVIYVAEENANAIRTLYERYTNGAEITEGNCIIVQHAANYVSIYRNVRTILCHTGDNLQAGQTIALGKQDSPLYYELWQNATPCNPLDVILF